MTPEDKEYMYFENLEKDTLSVSKRFENKQYLEEKEIEIHSRAVSMKFGESTNHMMTKRF